MARSDTTRATVLDRALASSRSISVTGPLTPLDIDRVRARLDLAMTPTSRLSVVPDPASTRWLHDTTPPPVVERPDLADRSPGEILDGLRKRTEPVGTVEYLLCGRWLVLDQSHGIGDGRVSLEQIAGLAGHDGSAMAPNLERALPASAAWQAAYRHLVRHPSRLREIARLRHANAAEESDGPSRTLSGWRSTRGVVATSMPADRVAALRAAVNDSGMKASAPAVTVALWRAAVAGQGVAVDPRTQVLFDCRRYLDPAHAADHGNLAVGIPLRFPDSATPAEVGERIRAVAQSGWPAAILGVGELRGLLRPRRAVPDDADPDTVTVPDCLRLSVSDMGRIGVFGDVAWDPTATSHHLYASLEPDGPDAATTFVSEVDGTRSFTTTFYGAFVDRAVIEAAHRSLCDDPVSLFRQLVAPSTSHGS
ncbi:hypothetical protein JTZ10_04770 [Gordonia rubripertincta]|uniref:Condensation domain-containing protein n=1 Tax=Gordonia rubripertincta TaxID=36822 RepID=A0AAW4G1R2_GORRU|nr:hypothetical protein [Gordonia rubripertincta]MBM7277065.1 hypothetical protein [Gordonia rubripertincta]